MSTQKSFPPDTEGQETAPLPADGIMDIIYHSMPTTWEIKTIEQSFNNADFSVKDFFETRVENLEPKGEKKKSSAAAKKTNQKESFQKWKQANSDLSVVESSKESSVDFRPVKKYCILHVKCSHSIDKCMDLYGLTIKHWQSFMSYRESNNELNALIEKKLQKFMKNKKRKKKEKEL